MEIEDAIKIACEAHRGQKDKAGEPYILHVLRVALVMPDDLHRRAALWHDIIEDCKDRHWQPQDAAWPYVKRLTKALGETYAEYIARVKVCPVARRVKLADLTDNFARCIGKPEFQGLAERYSKAIEVLEAE